MAEGQKLQQYDAENLALVAFHFGRLGEDAPVLDLIRQGADPNRTDRWQFTALHRAAHCNRPAVVRALLGAQADPNARARFGQTPLIGARSGEVAGLLLQAGADVNVAYINQKNGNVPGKTALMSAAWRGDTEVAAVLLEYRARIDLREGHGCNALMFAAWNDKSDMVRLLLEAGADVGLVEAALLNDYAQAQMLLTAGADLHPEDMTNALCWAAVGGHARIIRLLLDTGAALDAFGNQDNTALMQAALYGRMDVMRLLLERGADPNAINRQGGTALMMSVQSNTRSNREAVELLLAHGARANVRGQSGGTPLMLACMWGDTPVVKLLLKHGADPNVFTDADAMAKEGLSTYNALGAAVANGQIEAVKLLLRYGADPLAKNNADNNALDAARRGIRGGHKPAEKAQILPLLEANMQQAN